jgi:hypothetical protein
VLRFVFVPLKIQPMLNCKFRHFLILNEKIALAVRHLFIHGCLLAMLHLKKHGWCQTIFE